MSKCKPAAGTTLAALTSKGVRLNDIIVNGEHFVQIEIPYDLLLSDPEVQNAFVDIVYITSDDTSDET